MKRVFILFLAVLVTIATIPLFGQDIRHPRNAAGVFGGIEWNTLSGLTGIEYERVVHTRGALEVGVKGVYILQHKNGNLQLLNGSYGGTTSTGMLMATTHYFTGAKKERLQGFFLYGGLGLGQRKTQYDNTSHMAQVPVIDLGIGLRFPMGERAALSWTTGITFAGEGGITLTRLSVNF